MAVDRTLAKSHLRVTSTAEDTLIDAYLAAAKAWVENYTGKKLTSGQVTQTEAAFGTYLPLYWGPESSGLSIAYIDANDTPATLADAVIVRDRAYPADAWPPAAANTSVTLTYTAGYTTTPADLDHAVLLLVGEYFDNRNAGEASSAVTAAVESLCRTYRSAWV